ncbi:MAG: MFS transporter [Planctomycetaceae bacterium]|nr:MFS transporter [Planctomycetaceae bacterium]
MNRYHWFVLAVSALGWLFDCLDQQLFLLARGTAMKDLLQEGQDINEYGGYATAIFVLGWATGGLIFGSLGDRIGRAKTMMITILVYSVCTGLSALSKGFWDFAFYRFITGLGVGGEFAVGVALVAEVMPDKARPHALGLLQALSAIGNVSAAFVEWGLSTVERTGGLPGAMDKWRIMFLIGALPALLALIVRWKLKEPEKWQQMKERGETATAGSYAALFRDPRWRKNAIIGLILACAGVIALWGIVFFVFDLVGSVMRKVLAEQGLSGADLDGAVGQWKGKTSLMLNLGAFSGMLAFTKFTQRTSRRLAFAVSFVGAMFSTAFTFWVLQEPWHIYVLVPIMGFFMLGIFGGYAIYFPELFPTYLRSTGTSFCYNVGRFLAASGPWTIGLLSSRVYGHTDEPLRYAGITMCSIFLVGLAILPFAPETKGQPLPE